jgi:hypothetical protein
MAGLTLTDDDRADAATSPRSWPNVLYRCQCGHKLHVYGNGRHSVFFELGDVGFRNPLMDRVCPVCGTPVATTSHRAGVPRRVIELPAVQTGVVAAAAGR